MSHASHACPACPAIFLSPLRAGDLEIDACPRCHGLWFDGEELRRSLTDATLAERMLQLDAASPAGEPQVASGNRDCPRCQKRMRETPVGQVSIDYCSRCRGIWLDHGELVLAIAQYRSGERGNLVVLNQLAEGLREAEKRGLVWLEEEVS